MRRLLFFILLAWLPILIQAQFEQKSTESNGKNLSDNSYEDLRNKAFSVKPTDLNINPPINQ